MKTYDELEAAVFERLERAQQLVYRLFEPSPLQSLPLAEGGTLLLKREDLSPVHSFKWRGPAFVLAELAAVNPNARVIACSAGNHAQGVAAACRKYGLRAEILMPVCVSPVKQRAVQTLGGDHVRIHLLGEDYATCEQIARTWSRQANDFFLHPFEDLGVIAGNATCGVEVIQQLSGPPPEVAFLQIGGGGLAAGVALTLRRQFPNIRLIGVEGQGQASMTRALLRQAPAPRADVDGFCDGTAVSEVGETTRQFAAHLLDEIVLVSNDEVALAIQWFWETCRSLAEPSGALGLAAWQKLLPHYGQCRSLVIVSGANVGADRLSRILSVTKMQSAEVSAMA